MKNLLQMTWLFLLLIIASATMAQNPEFNLKNYKTTNYERSNLDLLFNLNAAAGNSSDANNNSLTTNSYQNVLVYNLNVVPNYSKIIYSEKKIINYEAAMDIKNNYSNQWLQKKDTLTHTDKLRNSSGDYSVSGSYYQDNYYSSTNRNFLKFGGYISTNLTSQNSLSTLADSSAKSVVTSFTTHAGVIIGHGHGRIENVEDAVEAIYILNDLSKANLLNRKYTDTDIKVVADKITLIRKERYFDERLYRQKALKELFSLLYEIGLVRSGNIDIYNVLNDYHFMAGISQRPSGHKIEYYLSGSISYYQIRHSNSILSTYNNSNSKNLGFSCNYYFHDPISIKWQQDFTANFNVSNLWMAEQSRVDSNPDSKGETSNQTFSGNLGLEYSIGFFPNTRTYCGLTSDIYCFEYINSDEYDKNYHPTINASIGLNTYYYLSEKVRITGSFIVKYLDNREIEKTSDYNITSKQFSNIFNLGLNYFIF
jgi:hypothetical protein